MPENHDESSAVTRAAREYRAGTDLDQNARIVFDWGYAAARSFFVRRGVSWFDSDDLAQMTLSNAFAALERFRFESSFEHWFFTIARNELYAWRRDNRWSAATLPLHAERESESEIPHEDIDPADLRPDPARVAYYRDRLDEVQKIVDAMPPRRQACFRLHFFQGNKVREVAAMLSITVGAVSASINQARQELEDHLGELGVWT